MDAIWQYIGKHELVQRVSFLHGRGRSSARSRGTSFVGAHSMAFSAQLKKLGSLELRIYVFSIKGTHLLILT